MKFKEIKRFGDICLKTQVELKRYLYSILQSNGYKPVCQDGFLYANGEMPYLVTAHMDTVHEVQCKRYSVHNFKGKHRIQSKNGIGGDDRCGVWMIVRMILDGYRPSILFCEDEEVGGIGSNKFCETEYLNDLLDMKFLIELDRANEKDAVFYDCDNPEFTKYIEENTGYKEEWGSFSDISHLCPSCGVAGVNLSCGYYKAHTTQEYVIFEEMENTLRVVEKLLRLECEQFEYIPAKYKTRGYFADDWYGDYYSTLYGKKNTGYVINGMEILYNTYLLRDGTYYPQEDTEWVCGESEDECLGQFFQLHPDTCFNDILDYYVM